MSVAHGGHGGNMWWNPFGRIEHQIQQLSDKVDTLLAQGVGVMSAIDDLATQVQANTDAEASAVTLIQGIATQLAASAGDAAKVTALSTQLRTSADALAAAIVANTPAQAA